MKWPYGYTAYLHHHGVGLGMRAVLVDDAGQVVANQGDIVAFEGNMGPERTFYICPGTRVFRIVSPDDEGPRP